MVWKTSTDACFTTEYTGKNIVDMVLPVSSKVELGNICAFCLTSTTFFHSQENNCYIFHLFYFFFYFRLYFSFFFTRFSLRVARQQLQIKP